MLGRLSALDMHPKLVSDFAARTSMGGALSLAALAVALALAASEAVWFATPARIENQTVDSMRAAHIRLVWDVTFPSTPCAALSMDVTDTAGVHKLPVQGMVSYKRRLSESGRAIGGAERAGMNTLKSKDELLALSEAQAQAKKSNIEGGCGSCYGAGEADECCNSCDDVREAYRKKGWQLDVAIVTQCLNDGSFKELKAQLESREGCQMFGEMQLPKVPGNVHFAPDAAIQHAAAHVQDIVSFAGRVFNVSHTVNAWSFGDVEKTRTFPMDGHTKVLAAGTGMHQYFIKLVPTSMKTLAGKESVYYQFSVTEHCRNIDINTLQTGSAQGLLPGVHMNYELSPIMVAIEEKRRSFLHFLTRLIAIVGGVFVFMGAVDSLWYRGMGKWLAKRRGGSSSLLD